MTKEEIMDFLHEKVFDPILDSRTALPKTKSGVNLTVARMSRLSAEKMIQYFWSALVMENAQRFADELKAEGQPRFEDVQEEFKRRFDDSWLQS